MGKQGKAEEMNQEHKLQREKMGCHRAVAQGGEYKGPVVNDSKFMSIFTSGFQCQWRINKSPAELPSAVEIVAISRG